MSVLRGKKWLLVLLAVIVLAVLLLPVVLSGMVDASKALDPLRESVRQLTGQELITEEVSTSLFFSPKIEVRGVAIRNPVETREPYLLYADRLTIAMSWDALLSDNPTPSALQLDGLRLYLEKSRTGGKSWHFLQKSQQKAAALSQALRLQLTRASITYVDVARDESIAIERISGQVDLSAQGLKANISGQMMDLPVAMASDCRVVHFTHLNQYDARCKADIKGKQMQAKADYRLLNSADKGLQVRGSMHFQAADARLWGDAFGGQKQQPLQNYVAGELPLSFSAETYRDNSRFVVNLSSFEMAQSSGQLSFSSQTGARGGQDMQLKAALARLDFDTIKSLIATASGTDADVFADADLFDPSDGGTVEVTARQLNYNGVALRDARFSGRLGNGQLTVKRAFAKLPEHGQVSTIGRLIASAGGLQYEGSVEASGKGLWSLTPLAGWQATPAGRQTLNTFRTRFNASIGPRDSIISELRLLIGADVRIAGGVTLNTKTIPTLSGSLSIENADLKPLWREWRAGKTLLEPLPEFASEPYAFDWLKRLSGDANVQLQFSNVQLPYDTKLQGRLRLTLAEQTLGAQEVDLLLDEMRVSGQASIGRIAEKRRPLIKTDLRFSRLMLDNWLRESMWRAEKEAFDASAPSVWSKGPLNFNPLRYFDGELMVKADQIEHEAFAAENLSLDMVLADEVLTVRDWQMQLWNGAFEGRVVLDASALPSLHVRYQHNNLDIRSLMEAFFGQSALSGRLSMANTLKTSGVNFDEWVRNLGGGLRFEGKNLLVRKFNLARLVQLLSSARSVAELANIMRQVETGGSARISNVKGVMHYEDAALKTTQIDLSARGVVGKIVASLDILKWQMDSSIRLGFVKLKTPSGLPQLRVRYLGQMDDAQRTLNLKSLEAYLTQKHR